jgi:hypothetical protein
MGYGLKLNIDLTAGMGSVDEKGKVLVDFSAASISMLELINDPPAEVISFFEQWLENNPVTYELGQLSMQDLGTHLTPKKFIIRTQCAPTIARRVAKDTGYGAVLLFIATDYNPSGGDFPNDSYPWLIPEENSSAILVNNRVVVEQYVKPALDNILDTGTWELARGNGNDDAYYLQASDNATIRIGYIRVSTASEEDPSSKDATWSGDYKAAPGYKEIHKDFIYSLRKATVTSDQDAITLNFDKSNKFSQEFAGKWFHCASGPNGTTCGYYDDRGDLDFTIDGKVVYDLSISEASESISIAFRGNNSVVDSNFESSFMYASSYMAKVVAEKLRDTLQISSNILEDVTFRDIDVFAVNHVLFPEQNINRLESAYFPGDIVIFGDIKPSLTSLQLTPLTSTVAAGGTLQFTTNAGSKKVEYSLSPADSGAISDAGLYQAPATINGSVVNVKVTATTEDGSSSALIKVLPQSVQVSPAFFNLNEANPKGVSLRAFFVGNGNTLKEWRLESSVPGLTGNIASDGFYTPPEVDLPYGYTYVTATAISTDGSSSSALILLVSKDTHAEFKVTPSLITNLPAGSVQTLSANSSLDFDPNKWSNYPAVGTLSEPIKDVSEYTVEYTSSADAKGEKLVVISAIQDGRPHRAGYSLIDVANFHN